MVPQIQSPFPSLCSFLPEVLLVMFSLPSTITVIAPVRPSQVCIFFYSFLNYPDDCRHSREMYAGRARGRHTLSRIFSLPDIDCLSTKPFADSCDSKWCGAFLRFSSPQLQKPHWSTSLSNVRASTCDCGVRLLLVASPFLPSSFLWFLLSYIFIFIMQLSSCGMKEGKTP